MTKEIITEKLVAAGIPAESIEWRSGSNSGKPYDYFRYNYWRPLPDEALSAISEHMYEDLYEDDDGDDDRGRPIIRRLWSYHFKTPKTV